MLDDGTFARYTSVNEFNYVCDECGKQFESKTRPDYGFNFGKEDEKPYICKRCRGLNHNPFKGKKHTDEYKKRMSEEKKVCMLAKRIRCMVKTGKIIRHKK